MKQLKPMRKQRDIDMFEEWVSGTTFKKLAEKYGMTEDNVNRISGLYSWGIRKQQILTARYNKMQRALKAEAVKVSTILGIDAQKLLEDVVSKERNLDPDERTHLRAYFDRILKEIRLEDGRPTGDETNVVVGTAVTLKVAPEMADAFAMFAKSSKATLEVKQPDDEGKDEEDY